MLTNTLFEIAVYCNESWKGNFNESELQEMVIDYNIDLETSIKEKRPCYSIESLINGLHEDAINGNETASQFVQWLYNIIEGR